MNQRAVDFVHMWISANVHPSDIIDERRDAEEEYAVQCRMHAGLVGISATLMKIDQSCCWSAAEKNSFPANQDADAKSCQPVETNDEQ